jgi:long-chain acyl-CoA synthetase
MTGIFAKNREEWMILDISNALYGRTMVPLYDTLGLETISYVIEHANLHNCVCSKEGMDQIFKAGKIHNLKYLIALDPVSEEQRKKAGEMKLEIISWTQLIDEGKTKEVPYQDEIDLDHCFTFSYTSGTTGWPKGAMISHRNLLAVITGLHLSDGRPLSTDVYISYLPLPHVMERLIVWNGVYAGMEICFYGGDTNKLKDDIQKVRPTIFLSVPRIYNRFYGVMK